MFVVTGLHTKRRPHLGTDKSSATINRQGVERVTLAPAVSHSHRPLYPAKVSALSSRVVRCLSGSRMTWNDRNAFDRNGKGRRAPINIPLRRVAPPRVRRFIPKPLILVERMKARQLLLESSPSVASESRITPGSSTRSRTTITTPLSTRVTPPTRWIPTCSTLLSDLDTSSSVAIRASWRNGVVFGSGFGMIPRPVRPLSVVTQGDSSSSTDTFVVDSPCCFKQVSSSVPLLVMGNDATYVYLDVESDPVKNSIPTTGGPALVDSVAVNLVSDGLFEPAVTSTPFASSQATTNDVPPSITFIASTVYPSHPPEQIPLVCESSEIVSPTSRAVYPLNPPKSSYVVKLPNSGSAISSAPPATLSNVPRSALDSKQLSNSVASLPPALVLDGVFALPQPSQSTSPSAPRTLHDFPRPRKPLSRRSFSDTSNTSTTASPSKLLTTSPSSSSGRSGPGSPRSRLAHVLTASAKRQTTALVRVPPLIKGVQVSSDVRMQCEIERLRVRRAVRRGRGCDGVVGGDAGGRGAAECMSLASVGMVAKLRARWENGAMERCG